MIERERKCVETGSWTLAKDKIMFLAFSFFVIIELVIVMLISTDDVSRYKINFV